MKIDFPLPLVETILQKRAPWIGPLFPAYKNHVYRVLHFSFAFHDCQGDDRQKLIIAGCFHDLGIWLGRWPHFEFDYLAPSIALARDYLAEQGQESWSQEIAEMIEMHHKLRRVAPCASPLVEAFRKADWVDATLGLRRFGLPRADVHQVQSAFASLGFHAFLARLAWAEFKRRPFHPLPMMKW